MPDFDEIKKTNVFTATDKKVKIKAKDNGYEPYIDFDGKKLWLRRVLVETADGFKVFNTNLKNEFRSTAGIAPIETPYVIGPIHPYVITVKVLAGPLILRAVDFEDPKQGGRLDTEKTALIVDVGKQKFWGGYRNMYDLVLTRDLVTLGDLEVERMERAVSQGNAPADVIIKETASLRIRDVDIPVERELSSMAQILYLERRVGDAFANHCEISYGREEIRCTTYGDEWDAMIDELQQKHKDAEDARTMLDSLTVDNYRAFFTLQDRKEKT